jgi:hypothetical protein
VRGKEMDSLVSGVKKHQSMVKKRICNIYGTGDGSILYAEDKFDITKNHQNLE